MAGTTNNGRRRLILHLGVQKTGSTAIQRFLRQNADALSDDLIVRTPVEGTPMRPLGRAAIAHSLSNDPDTATALRLAFADVLAELPDNGLPVLISHENLAGAMPGNGGETRLYPALPEILSLLRTEAKGFEIEAVVYTRNMKQWKSSVWAQAVRTDGYAKTEEAFLADIETLPGWGDLIRRLGQEIGAENVCRCRLEDEADATRPAGQLLRHAGLDDARIAALTPLQGQSMPRLSASSTEFLRRLNGLSLNPYARGKVADLVARAQPLFAAEWPSEGTS